MATGTQIVQDFVATMRNIQDTTVTRSSLSRNAYRVSGSETCIVYIKGRAQLPYNWGVTVNVISRLNSQATPWFLVLLYERKDTGYLLNSSEVSYYTNGVWPIGRDGDYKPSSGAYLHRSKPLKSFAGFMRSIGVNGT